MPVNTSDQSITACSGPEQGNSGSAVFAGRKFCDVLAMIVPFTPVNTIAATMNYLAGRPLIPAGGVRNFVNSPKASHAHIVLALALFFGKNRCFRRWFRNPQRISRSALTTPFLHMPYLPPAVLPEIKIFAAYAVFLGSYLVFAIGKFPGMKIDRPGAAIIGGVLMVAFRVVLPQNALHFIDFSTIVLLFSMMLIVGYLRLAGFFEWIAELILMRLRPHHLLPTVIFICGLLSAFFVNDIICLVMVPFVLSASRRLGVRPIPYLLAVATASNIGSVATITGNPQNMLIGSLSGIRYSSFLLYLAPVAVVGLLLDWLVLHVAFSRAGMTDPSPARAVADLAGDRSSLIKPGIVVLVVLGGFVAGVPPAMMAALGAAMMLMTRTRDPHQAYRQVDWGILVFFVGLFVIVGGAEKAGLADMLLDFARTRNLQSPGIFTVVVAALSNLVSNVPAVMLLKSVVPGFANSHSGWLILAMASTLAGNLTITGSVANIIVVEGARPEVHISFRDYFRVGLPVTLLTLGFGLLWLWWVM
jgi:Na+/H+ antiporter NhaD/arsenite permease-like protein